MKEENQYRLNSLAKSILEEKGFSVYFDNTELPPELAGNKCDALMLEVQQRKSMFITNLTVLLKDCQGNIIFKSKEGKSREKEYNVSYNLALRDAFTSFDDVHYVYNEVGKGKSLQVVTPAFALPSQTEETLYAQATANGYQLINTAPKIVLTLFKTTAANCFIADSSSAHGIVLKKDQDWVFEYYKNGQLVSEVLKIKF